MIDGMFAQLGRSVVRELRQASVSRGRSDTVDHVR
jgi:hypothetical protein